MVCMLFVCVMPQQLVCQLVGETAAAILYLKHFREEALTKL